MGYTLYMRFNYEFRSLKRWVAVCLAVLLCPWPDIVFGQTHGSVILPAPGTMVQLSPAHNPPLLKGIKVHPDNPFRFEFVLDKGDSHPEGPSHSERSEESQKLDSSSLRITPQNDRALKGETNKLIKYFLAAITVPEQDLWVNLSPYEKDRIIPDAFGKTEMGRDLLAQDYILKQLTASLMYPEDEVGKKFWKRVYEESARKFGNTNIPVNTFNKVWIVPEKAVVYENVKNGTAYVVESKLKVMLEEDYLSKEKHISPPLVGGVRGGDLKHLPPPNLPHKGGGNSEIGNQIIREVLIPQLYKEINQGQNFAQLRQVYNSLILATWYKKKSKQSILSQVYADKNKIQGVGYTKSVILSEAKDLKQDPSSLKSVPQDDGDVETIYQNYLQSFKKGAYNYIKEEEDPVTKVNVPRKYFSGGANMAMTVKVLETIENPTDLRVDSANLMVVDMAMHQRQPNNKTKRILVRRSSKERTIDLQKMYDRLSRGPVDINDLERATMIPRAYLYEDLKDPFLAAVIQNFRYTHEERTPLQVDEDRKAIIVFLKSLKETTIRDIARHRERNIKQIEWDVQAIRKEGLHKNELRKIKHSKRVRSKKQVSKTPGLIKNQLKNGVTSIAQIMENTGLSRTVVENTIHRTPAFKLLRRWKMLMAPTSNDKWKGKTREIEDSEQFDLDSFVYVSSGTFKESLLFPGEIKSKQKPHGMGVGVVNIRCAAITYDSEGRVIGLMFIGKHPHKGSVRMKWWLKDGKWNYEKQNVALTWQKFTQTTQDVSLKGKIIELKTEDQFIMGQYIWIAKGIFPWFSLFAQEIRGAQQTLLMEEGVTNIRCTAITYSLVGEVVGLMFEGEQPDGLKVTTYWYKTRNNEWNKIRVSLKSGWKERFLSLKDLQLQRQINTQEAFVVAVNPDFYLFRPIFELFKQKGIDAEQAVKWTLNKNSALNALKIWVEQGYSRGLNKEEKNLVFSLFRPIWRNFNEADGSLGLNSKDIMSLNKMLSGEENLEFVRAIEKKEQSDVELYAKLHLDLNGEEDLVLKNLMLSSSSTIRRNIARRINSYLGLKAISSNQKSEDLVSAYAQTYDWMDPNSTLKEFRNRVSLASPFMEEFLALVALGPRWRKLFLDMSALLYRHHKLKRSEIKHILINRGYRPWEILTIQDARLRISAASMVIRNGFFKALSKAHSTADNVSRRVRVHTSLNGREMMSVSASNLLEAVMFSLSRNQSINGEVPYFHALRTDIQYRLVINDKMHELTIMDMLHYHLEKGDLISLTLPTLKFNSSDDAMASTMLRINGHNKEMYDKLLALFQEKGVDIQEALNWAGDPREYAAALKNWLERRFNTLTQDEKKKVYPLFWSNGQELDTEDIEGFSTRSLIELAKITSMDGLDEFRKALQERGDQDIRLFQMIPLELTGDENSDDIRQLLVSPVPSIRINIARRIKLYAGSQVKNLNSWIHGVSDLKALNKRPALSGAVSAEEDVKGINNKKNLGVLCDILKETVHFNAHESAKRLNALRDQLLGTLNGAMQLSARIDAGIQFNWSVLGEEDRHRYNIYFYDAIVNKDGFLEFTVQYKDHLGEHRQRSFEIGRFIKSLSGKTIDGTGKRSIDVMEIVPKDQVARRLINLVMANEGRLIRPNGERISEEHKLADVNRDGSTELVPVENFVTVTLPLLGFKDVGWTAYVTNAKRTKNSVFVFDVSLRKPGSPSFKKSFEIGRNKIRIKSVIDKSQERNIYAVQNRLEIGNGAMADVFFTKQDWDPKSVYDQLFAMKGYPIATTSQRGFGSFRHDGFSYKPVIGPREIGWQVYIHDVILDGARVIINMGYRKKNRNDQFASFVMDGSKAKAFWYDKKGATGINSPIYKLSMLKSSFRPEEANKEGLVGMIFEQQDFVNSKFKPFVDDIEYLNLQEFNLFADNDGNKVINGTKERRVVLKGLEAGTAYKMVSKWRNSHGFILKLKSGNGRELKYDTAGSGIVSSRKEKVFMPAADQAMSIVRKQDASQDVAAITPRQASFQASAKLREYLQKLVQQGVNKVEAESLQAFADQWGLSRQTTASILDESNVMLVRSSIEEKALQELLSPYLDDQGEDVGIETLPWSLLEMSRMTGMPQETIRRKLEFLGLESAGARDGIGDMDGFKQYAQGYQNKDTPDTTQEIVDRFNVSRRTVENYRKTYGFIPKSARVAKEKLVEPKIKTRDLPTKSSNNTPVDGKEKLRLAKLYLNLKSIIEEKVKQRPGQKLRLKRPVSEFLKSKGLEQLDVKRAAQIIIKGGIQLMENDPAGQDLAMNATGGIDMTAPRMDAALFSTGGTIDLHLDQAMLQKLKNADGFEPVIISMEPLEDIRGFLGISQGQIKLPVSGPASHPAPLQP